jgi:integrase
MSAALPVVAVTRIIPEAGLSLLRDTTTMRLWEHELPPSPEDLAKLLHGCDGALTLLTDLIADGVPLPVVAKQLGHASPAITMQVYAHMVPGQQREAADAIERLFGKGSV